ncbi:cupin domain-containing protein [Actinomadura logoneensis]|uniref:cupin domain-containing protein n=1 Tax=Actinomadura logoneensis TaxID=2293572 RepID=UPI0013140BB2|nr:cupin domain-containing protein [Actinomadura logoneensis]
MTTPARDTAVSTAMRTTTGLPAGIGLSQVQVYSSQAPDGQCGGTPHLHLTCTELYFTLRGRGAAEFLTSRGPERVPLEPGVAVQFTPGTVHRLVNSDDPLQVLVIMENGRLNEEGDVVFAFPDTDLADPGTYASLADTGPIDAPDLAAVTRRRDRAVTGFVQRTRAWHEDPAGGRAQLDLLHQRAAALVRDRAARWPTVIAQGPEVALRQLSQRAAAAQAGDPTHLAEGRVTVLPRFDAQALTPKMCGSLWSYAVPR